MSSEHIAVGTAVSTAAWNTAAVLMKMPELANAASAMALGAMGTWQLITAAIENRRKKK